MKEYKAPDFEIVSFDTEDIITSSGSAIVEPKSSITAPNGETVETASLGPVNFMDIK